MNILQISHAIHGHVAAACFQMFDKPIDEVSANKTFMIHPCVVSSVFDHWWLLTVKAKSQILACYNKVGFSRRVVRGLCHRVLNSSAGVAPLPVNCVCKITF